MKQGEGWDRWTGRLWLRPALLFVTALAAAVLVLITYETGAFGALERQSVDARFSVRGSRPPDSRIAIVAIDQKTLDAVDVHPPLPRLYYARLLDRLRRARPQLIALDVVFDGRRDPRDDHALIDAIARDGPVVIGTEQNDSGAVLWPVGDRHAHGAVLASLAIDKDSDGVLRRMMYAPIQLPTLAVRAAQMIRGQPVSEAEFPQNHAWIDFKGPPGTFATYSASDVLDGHISGGQLRGKTVLVGVTDPLERDIVTTAVSSVPMAGVEVQANALSTILDGFPLQPVSGIVDIVLILGLAALPALLSLRLPSLVVVAVSILVLAAFLVGVQLAFDSGTIVPVPDPILALALGTIGAVAADAFVQRRQLRNLQVMFDLLPSPVADFFISYRRGQSELAANTLGESLARKFGEQRVYLDTASNEIGEEWPQRIEQAILACRAMLVVIGPQWSEARAPGGSRRLDDPSDWVRREIELGIQGPQIAVVPVLHDGAQMPPSADLPLSIRSLTGYQAVVLSGREMEAWIEQLTQSIHRGRLRGTRPPDSQAAGADMEPAQVS